MTYISTPCIEIKEHFLMQGHHLKYDNVGNLMFYFSGYTNEIQLPNPDLRLYKSPALTFTLVEQEEARRSLACRKSTWSRKRNEAGSSQQPPPTPTPPVPQMHMLGWLPVMYTLGFSLGYQPGWGYARTHRRLEGRVGTRLEGQDGMSNKLTLLTPRGYHRPSIHDSPL
jgi:hypothetical protein